MYFQGSEYVAWILVNRYAANHVTISMHHLKSQLRNIKSLNQFIEESGFKLNSERGVLKELDMDSSRNPESGEDRRVIAPQEACNQIAEVVQEALKKMEMVADEKMRMFKKAHQALEASELELDEKASEVL
ncbi:hypothetical protein LOK49_LG01G02567 [Camellia lanceoleosa]|uniref:Uncharacterized protein n=1 Tax=Camellia lanceoleosa TaxID=1840588 RepID=A0ACC0J376_9ERIC|nr:hypothetical protein LOK49_LG01G02567 [Camellia lanceoleosa]